MLTTQFSMRLTALSFVHSVIKVVVGPHDASRTFFVHEKLVVERAPFFERALNGQWKESDDKLVELPDDDPDVFFLYLQLLYTTKLHTRSNEPNKTSREYKRLVKLYVLAEKLQDVQTRNIVIEAMIAKTRDEESFPPSSIHLIYDGTPEGSPLRKLVVDLFTDFALPVDIQRIQRIKARERMPPQDFFLDLLLEFSQRRPKPSGETIFTCDPTKYHVKEPDA